MQHLLSEALHSGTYMVPEGSHKKETSQPSEAGTHNLLLTSPCAVISACVGEDDEDFSSSQDSDISQDSEDVCGHMKQNGDSIGRNVARLRSERNLSQDDLVVLLQKAGYNFTRDILANIETFRSKASEVQIRGLTRVLRVTVGELFAESADKPKAPPIVGLSDEIFTRRRRRRRKSRPKQKPDTSGPPDASGPKPPE